MPVPPNLIPDGATRITPDMLTLVTLDQDAIDAIVARVPGGAANVQDIYPLTPLQEGMLFHHLWSPDRDAYTEAYLLAFPSYGRVDRFIAALEHVVERHDILRTSIAWEGLESPVQVVQRVAELPANILDIDPSCGDVAAELERRAGVQQRLDLGRAPLLRCTAAHDRRGERWLLSVVFHHLAIDHMALAVLIEETRAIERGRIAELPPAVPFRAFMAQARFGMSQDEHTAFFRTMLGDIDEPTAPFGLVDARSDGSAVGEATRPLPRALSGAIRKHARRLGVSPASVMHLAWGTGAGADHRPERRGVRHRAVRPHAVGDRHRPDARAADEHAAAAGRRRRCRRRAGREADPRAAGRAIAPRARAAVARDARQRRGGAGPAVHLAAQLPLQRRERTRGR